MKRKYLLVTLTLLFTASSIIGQRRAQKKVDPVKVEKKEEKLNLSGLKMRNIGPAFASGRIADIAVHPQNDNIWYVATGSSGVWKTKNSGTTWKSIFEGQGSYSTGCVTIDPSNNSTVWLGTGENVGGRHVAFGDGIYKSDDDGGSWKNMGLKNSEHISKIIVHPDNSDVVYVAAQGPLWSKGGERGFYKTNDGGETWTQTLGNEDWTGVTDILMDPRNPRVIYAATWDRHRTIAAYMGGGPGSGIHRSLDGGETWEEMKSGIPGSNLGKIGLAMSPFNPDVLYAAIELDRKEGGVFMSSNMGKSWKKMSDAVSGATGPHYYQELYASPHSEGTLYLMDNRIQVSDDHGKSFRRLSEVDKHSDNHSINFRADDPNYLLVGTDAGIYETYDLAQNWRFIDNLPITQYYKVAVDDAKPFYTVYGGTQDNGSHGGPSRTDNQHGIRNADFFKTLGADGHQSAVEHGNPNIMYAETQQGGMNRIDRLTGEQVSIQPNAAAGEKYERFNWDAPFVVSTHKPTRLYFASYRVWKSEDRGDSWNPISGDLTKDQERITFPIMGRQQSWDNAWDMNAMSAFNTISSLAESPIKAGLLYVGTDDGIFQMSDDDGANWTKKELGTISGLPATSFVNNIYADQYDENTVYMALDNHKYGDYTPYIFKSTDKGASWTSMRSNLPDRLLVWRMVQDHIDPNLIFLATEFGIYFTNDGGSKWTKLTAGIPTISFRGITIQKRENDLVAASFGRGFFILDDYSPLRHLNAENLAKEAHLFPVKDAYWYVPRSVVGQMGASYYAAPNPEHGATFTFFVKDEYPTLAKARKKLEKKLNKDGKDVAFPGWEELTKEADEEGTKLVFIIKDASGDIVNMIEKKPSKGINRLTWNMRAMSKSAIQLPQNLALGQGRSGFGGQGFMVQPGKYSVSVAKKVNGEMMDLGESQEFNLVPLRDGAIPRKSSQEIMAFQNDFKKYQYDLTATNTALTAAEKRLGALKTASTRIDQNHAAIYKMIYDAESDLKAIQRMMSGDLIRRQIGERSPASPQSGMRAGFGALRSTYGPTENQINVVKGASGQLKGVNDKIAAIETVLSEIGKAVKMAGAPWIEGF